MHLEAGQRRSVYKRFDRPEAQLGRGTPTED
jgi:hypothetical protein